MTARRAVQFARKHLQIEQETGAFSDKLSWLQLI